MVFKLPGGMGRLETRPRPVKYRIVKKDVRLRSYGLSAYGRHVDFVFKLQMVLGSIRRSGTERAALWTLLLEWAPWEKVLQGEVPFDGTGGLGEERSVGILDTRELRGRCVRFEWLKVMDYKGSIFVGDEDEG